MALVGLATVECSDEQTPTDGPCPSFAKPVTAAISEGDAAPGDDLPSSVCAAYCTTDDLCALSADAGAVLCSAGCF